MKGQNIDKSNLCKTMKVGKAMKGVGLIQKLRCFLPRSSLLTIYKSFIRPHLDFGDVIYNQLSNAVFSSKSESVQHNTALANTNAIRGSSREKLYHELGLEYLHHIRWMRLLCLLSKVLSNHGDIILYIHVQIKFHIIYMT